VGENGVGYKSVYKKGNLFEGKGGIQYALTIFYEPILLGKIENLDTIS
jgi:hypothetical protein